MRILVVIAVTLGISACAQQTVPKVGVNISSSASSESPLVFTDSLDNGPTSGEESFSVAAYGVAASPIVARGSRLPRGGGYEKVGSPYVVKGRRYYPTRTPKLVQTGRASWYGKAFHGRKTANGEVYDMNHLTAAHKTMPLPSYARVTNVANGHSVIVRVNDRGPFSNNRVIDLSKRAAQVLDYTLAGTAQVKVEYIGPAPLHGQDDAYLMASIRGVKRGIVAPLPGVNSLPGVDGNIATASNEQSETPAIPLESAYAQWRVETAFDEFKTNKNGLLWKRMN